MRLYLRIVGALAVALSLSPSFAQKPKGYTYLALGDSIPFGFDPTEFKGGALPKPSSFTGYPEIVAKYGKLQHVNASCPGETSGSFADIRSPDNGCNGRGPNDQDPFKTSIGLHASYTGSQLEFALAQIRANRQINLITLSIGGNDLSLLQKTCPPNEYFQTCVGSGLLAVIPNFGANLYMILDGIRNKADYQGKLILVTNYSPSADPLVTYSVDLLNVAMKRVGSTPGAMFDVTIADGFGAFQAASQQFSRNPCTAGLLVRLSATVCDIHPSEYGQNVLAATVVLAAGQ